MSGHSKWSQIKRQKGVSDQRRGQLFTKLIREIAIAVHEGGGDPAQNAHLRLTIQKAKESNMPLENIERAIKRASGSGEGASLLEATVEGYGPGGVAILVKVLTDNRNRALQEVRSVLYRGGGSMGEAGCVAWMFESKGVIIVDKRGVDAEEVALEAIDAGAEDVTMEKDYVEVRTTPQQLESIYQVLQEREVPIISSDISMLPKMTVNLDEKKAMEALRLIDRLDELDDVQRVFSNVDFSEEVGERLKAGSLEDTGH
jgi:YebC/PmpR family DNA-binding regulatory protein